MQTGQYLRGTILGSWLIAAGAAQAQDVMAETTGPTLYGSPATIARLASIKNTFLNIADMDVLVIQRSDLFTAAEERQMTINQSTDIPAIKAVSEDVARQRMNEFLRPFADVMPRSMKTAMPERSQDNPPDTNILLHYLTEQTAVSSLFFDEEKTVCSIMAPAPEQSTENIFLRLAELPRHYNVTHADAYNNDDIYDFIMFHEAAHCAQDYFEGEIIAQKIQRLDGEINADNTAFTHIKTHLSAKHLTTYFQGMRHFLESARAIGALRHGNDIFDDIENFPSHVTHIYRAEENPEFEYDAADVALATKLTGTAINLFTAFNHAADMIGAEHPGIIEMMQNTYIPTTDVKAGDVLIRSLKTTGRLGQWINSQYPAVQFGTMHMVRDALEKLIDDTTTTRSPGTDRMMHMSLRLMDNYLGAVRTYLPGLAHDPVGKNVYDKATAGLEDLIKKLMNDPRIPGSGTSITDGSILTPGLEDSYNFLLALHGRSSHIGNPGGFRAMPDPAPSTGNLLLGIRLDFGFYVMLV